MTSRILPPEEWHRLARTELEQVWPVLDPLQAHIVVVEQGAQIVACWAAIRYVHVEGVWVHPDHRGKGRAAGHLVRQMRSLTSAMGAKAVWTAALTDQVRRLIAHFGGVKLPGEHYVMSMGGE